MAILPSDSSVLVRNSSLKSHWERICADSAVPAEWTVSWLQKLLDLYSEPGRHYHTLEHISELTNWIARYQTQLKNLNNVGFAVWFHDCIYDCKRNDNEEKSAELWLEFAKGAKLPDAVAILVSDYIIATKAHSAAGHEDDLDLKYFLDFDTVILAAPEKEYDRYARNIRKEYRHFPLDIYRQGRAAVLKSFLTKSVFVTEEFNTKHGPAAKANLEREIDSLPTFEDQDD